MYAVPSSELLKALLVMRVVRVARGHPHAAGGAEGRGLDRGDAGCGGRAQTV